MPPAPAPPPLAAPLALAALLACSHAAGLYRDIALGQNERSTRALGNRELPHGCLYEGRWFTEGTAVLMRDACLSCACARGALACRRRACSPLPDPPPHRCHMLHRRGSCCPELHCPDGVTLMEHAASSRYENEDFSDIATPASIIHACVEGGTIYSAGSAMSSNTACEQCFCLGGARRCVRPKCLPPPPACTARPAPGACCPQRYYCEHVSTKPPEEIHVHDCQVESAWISEGERVVSAEAGANCTQCFCLRGKVRCQPLACAPPLMGCTPLLRQGECCAHQYHCEHKLSGLSAPYFLSAPDNGLLPTRYVDRALHTSKSTKPETTTKNSLSSVYTVKNTPTSATQNHLIATTKVKRKTNEPPPVSSSQKPDENANITTTTEKSQKPKFAAKLIAASEEEASTTESDKTSTEQPEGSVRVMINGTINCTSEFSTSLPLNNPLSDIERIKSETQPRIPIVNIDSIEDHTFYPNDIITDRSVNDDFDENETFTINVTSSLRTNTSHSTPKAPMPMPTITKIALSPTLVDSKNNSKKTKGDYDYDYTEPTLPPSLPNLKIIPFVAADAVVDEEPSKETLTYPMLEREDKFPVYYPSVDTKDTPYATRREDIYNPTQYPVFVSKKEAQYPSLTHEVDLTNTGFSNIHNDLGTMHEYTVSTSIGNRISEVDKAVSKLPSTNSTFKLDTPALNLFSPPMETEGGFIPKGPGFMDDFYTVYSSTPASSVPHLTTSMQLDVSKGECIANDGRRIPEGDTITLSCSDCICGWGELHCSPRLCSTPPGCRRRPASSNTGDLCCGDLICNQDNKTTIVPEITTQRQVENKTTFEINYQTAAPTSPPFKNNNTTYSNINTSITERKPIEHMNNKINNGTVIDGATNISKTTVLPTSPTTTEMPSTKPVSTTTVLTEHKEVYQTNNHSLEYDDEEEEEGFSFGNVLKLLLSEYESTTVSQFKNPSTRSPSSTKPTPITTTTAKRPSPKPSIAPFIPLPPRPYILPRKSVPLNTVNRIDHLVLGEATAIKKTTPHPASVTFKPVSSFKPMPSKSQVTTKPAPVTKQEEPATVAHDEPKPNPGIPGIGPGLLKLAGCNIYGTMYRVGRIIAELSTPCEECWCTELGIQCKQLSC